MADFPLGLGHGTKRLLLYFIHVGAILCQTTFKFSAKKERKKEKVSEVTEQLWILSLLSCDRPLHLKQLRLLTRSGFTQRLMLFITLRDKCSPSGRMVRPGSSAPQLVFYVTFNRKSLNPPQHPDIKYQVLMIL